MGLETGSFVSDLVTTNPVSSDARAQGDDHLRLIKIALQGSFPTASKAWYNPSYVAKTANYTILAADMNKLISFDATSGALVPTLPSLASGDAGWTCQILKIDSSTNAVTITPASGTISGASTIVLAVQWQSAELIWSGTTWYVTRFGQLGINGNVAFTGGTTLSIAATSSIPIVELYKNATTAVDDIVGGIDYYGKDSGGNKQKYAAIYTSAKNVTNGAEQSWIFIDTFVAGVQTNKILVGDTTTSFSGGIFTSASVQASVSIVGGTISGSTGTFSGALSGASAAGAMLATQAEQETATATDRIVTPGRQHFHPSAAKFFLKSVVSAGVPQAPSASYNVTSVSDPGTAQIGVTIGNDFSGTEWVAAGLVQATGGSDAKYVIVNGNPAAGSANFYAALSSTTGGDPLAWQLVGFGDL